MSTFGVILKEKRRAASLSQRQLAEKVGVDFSYISKLENDRLQAPAADTIARIAECVGCPVEDLLAAAKKMPAGLNDSLINEPTAVRFLQEASKMQLTPDEWQRLLGQLYGLREETE
ncbi:MAG: helix-turn-helix domain-containing protein [Planctomycetes bacterium]|nr:helix-turn-helix domain-containing protein [Planctomycetota bacterium]